MQWWALGGLYWLQCRHQVQDSTVLSRSRSSAQCAATSAPSHTNLRIGKLCNGLVSSCLCCVLFVCSKCGLWSHCLAIRAICPASVPYTCPEQFTGTNVIVRNLFSQNILQCILVQLTKICVPSNSHLIELVIAQCPDSHEPGFVWMLRRRVLLPHPVPRQGAAPWVPIPCRVALDTHPVDHGLRVHEGDERLERRRFLTQGQIQGFGISCSRDKGLLLPTKHGFVRTHIPHCLRTCVALTPRLGPEFSQGGHPQEGVRIPTSAWEHEILGCFPWVKVPWDPRFLTKGFSLR